MESRLFRATRKLTEGRFGLVKKKKWKPQKAAKLPTVDKGARPQRPRAEKLKTIYSGLITNSESQFVAALTEAIHWYDDMVRYAEWRAPLTEKQNGVLLEARVFHTAGIEEATNQGKIRQFRQAIDKFQTLGRLLFSWVPGIERYLAVAAEHLEGLNEIEKRFMARYATVMVALERGFKPTTLDGRPVKLKVGVLKDPLILDAENATITFDRKEAKKLYKIMATEGLFSVAVEAYEPLARLQATLLEKGKNGKLTGRKIIEPSTKNWATDVLWHNLLQYALSEEGPRRFVKRKYTVTTGNGTRLGSNRAKDPTGQYMADSSIGKLTTTLWDGEWHEISELAKMIAPTDAHSRLEAIHKKGKELGQWQLEYQADKVRLVKCGAGH
jgi:hypothetical protein